MGDFLNVSMGNGILYINNRDVGFLKGDVGYKYNYDIEDFKTNTPKVLHGSFVKEVTAELTAPIAEISAENLAVALGGLPVVEETGALVDKTATFESHTFTISPWTRTGGIEVFKLGDSNDTGMKVTISDGLDAPVVKDSTEATTYAEGDDYIVDYTTGYVFRNPAGSISTGQTVKVKYKYTPPAGRRIDLGVQYSLTRVKLEFVHPLVNLPGKCVRVVMWKAVSNGSIELNFAEDNVIVNNITFKAVYDSTNPANPLGFWKDGTDL